MSYEYDEQAQQEAADHPVSKDQVERLKGQCRIKASELGEEGVRAHTVCFSVTAWDKPPGLTDSVPRTGFISRGDVLDIAQRVHAGTLPATELLVASFVWGWGRAGFGPRRLRDICAAAGDRLESSLQRVLAASSRDSGPPDPIAGYAQLYGGCDYKSRVAPGKEPWSRLHGYGPAFFTKFLYFSTPAP